MISLLLLTVLTQTAPAPRIAVIDISAGDAIYEDISRGLAENVVNALNAVGNQATRIDETQMPKGCHSGPCLGIVAQQQQADIVVTLDAADAENEMAKVTLTSLRGINGEFLGGAKYTVKPGQLVQPKQLMDFAKASLTALTDKAPKVALEKKSKPPKKKKR